MRHAQRNANRMTKQLAGWSECAWQLPGGAGLSHTLACAHPAAAAGGGCGQGGRQPSDAELLAVAKANLERMCWVGLQVRAVGGAAGGAGAAGAGAVLQGRAHCRPPALEQGQDRTGRQRSRASATTA